MHYCTCMDTICCFCFCCCYCSMHHHHSWHFPVESRRTYLLLTHPVYAVPFFISIASISLSFHPQTKQQTNQKTEVATMDNNQLSGTMPCASIADLSFLQVLTADCLGAPNRPSPPLVICECCTQCF